jgi:hypothetical protein
MDLKICRLALWIFILCDFHLRRRPLMRRRRRRRRRKRKSRMRRRKRMPVRSEIWPSAPGL